MNSEKFSFQNEISEEEAPSKAEQLELLSERAAKYRKMGKVAMALASYENRESDEPLSEEQTDAFIQQFDTALNAVGVSLQNQLDYNIVNHKQINTKEALEEELQSGTAIPELDIRFDENGKPWVSHSPRSGTRFLFSKQIHKSTSEEVEEVGQRLSLEDALKLVGEYNENGNHRVVLEIKELGPNEEGRKGLLKNIGQILEDNGLKDTAIFATLSPDLLTSIHDEFSENSKILNGGIAPVISCEIEKSLDDNLKGGHEFPIKFPGMELFISSLVKEPKNNDGYGKQTGYLWMRLPKETVKTLAKMNEQGQIGGASLTIVNKMANVMGMFNPKAAQNLRKKYADKVHSMGIRVQTAISKSKPTESLVETREAMGKDTIFYSDVSPGDYAEYLPQNPE